MSCVTRWGESHQGTILFAVSGSCSLAKYPVRLDAKNRVIVPQRLRESQIEGGPLWSKFYLTLGTEACIAGLYREGWQQMMQEMGASKSVVEESVRILQRMTAAKRGHARVDVQGRIVLSDELRHARRNHARPDLDRRRLARGNLNPERWTAFQRKHTAELGEKMGHRRARRTRLPNETIIQGKGRRVKPRPLRRLPGGGADRSADMSSMILRTENSVRGGHYRHGGFALEGRALPTKYNDREDPAPPPRAAHSRPDRRGPLMTESGAPLHVPVMA